jgi:Na+-driven multidrug efflux pump
VFAGSVPLWIFALLSSALRGAGDAKTPARVTLAGAVLLIVMSPALIFGWGPLPRLGIAGAGAAVVIYYVLAAVMLIGYMRTERSPLKLTIVRPDRRLFGEILGTEGKVPPCTARTFCPLSIGDPESTLERRRPGT